MWIGYNTNGFAHHRLEDALCILADLGYQGVAITLDYHALNPYDSDLLRQVQAIRALLDRLGLRSVVETGARFLLDPWRKHQPTLLDPDESKRQRRRDLLFRAVTVARELGSEVVSFWSGSVSSEEDRQTLLSRLADECRRLADHAADSSVRLAFEPEPGMFIATLDDFADLEGRVRHPAFGLTVDIGHLHCQGELPIAEKLCAWNRLLWNVHIEDMRRGVHEHLQFGEGEIDFGPVIEALKCIGYRGGLCVELSRHSHDAVNAARHALHFLRRFYSA
ncbi:MAG: sugar phosphate isomerase/epimerase [Gemmatales bacterium]|nr:sugar phosphate isomerase/epimerase [Gemmatales bacterium]MDW8388253.1 sugar phosphate isomerase/epimerase family protein [Gemmatales bacterium]